MFGFKIKVRFTQEGPHIMIPQTLRNVTDIYWGYGTVTFLSDVHGTGIAYDTSEIAGFKAALETDVAGRF